MDILNKIDKMRKQRNWSIYKLAEESELTQSTIANMFARGTLPTISTLSQICQAFGITLSEFFNEDNNSYTQDEELLLQNFRKLDSYEKEFVAEFVFFLLEKRKN